MLQVRISAIFIFLFISIFCLAQSIDVPTASTQYLNKTNDYSSIKFYLKYDKTTKKVNFLINEKEAEFSQKVFNEHLKDRLEMLNSNIAEHTNVQIYAPKNIPISYLQDIYAWLQIRGNLYWYLVAKQEDKFYYMPLDVMPFKPWKQACDYYADKHHLGTMTSIDILAKEHPSSTEITTTIVKKENTNSKRSTDYIPHNLNTIYIKDGNNVFYKGQQINPIVLGAMIQSDLAANYQSAMQRATPKQYIWFNIKADKNISYQIYIDILLAVREGFYLYWDELAFNQYEKTYLELSLQEIDWIQSTSPLLITQYDAIQELYIKDKLGSMKAKIWEEIK